MVHVFRGSMYFPLTAGAAPRGVSVRVYRSPSNTKPFSSDDKGNFALELRSGGVSVFEQRFRVDRPVLGLNHLPRTIRDGDKLSVADFKRFTVSVVEPPVYDSFSVLWAGRELFAAEQSANAPRVEILGVSEDQIFGSRDIIDLCLRGIDDDGDQLTYRVYYSTDDGDTYRLYNGLNFYLFVDWTEITSSNVMIFFSAFLRNADRPQSALDSGLVSRIGVSVSDGASSTFIESPAFTVFEQGARSFGVRITSPKSSYVFSSGETILLDAELGLGLKNDVEYNWHSSLDGNLGTSKLVQFLANDLTVGEHWVNVVTTDVTSKWAYSDFVRFFVIPEDVPFKALDDTLYIPPGEAFHIVVAVNDIKVSSPYRLKITVAPKLGRAQIEEGISDVPTGQLVRYLANTSGRDSFEYEVCDWDSFCDTATVHVSVGLDDCTISGTDEDDTLVGTPGDDIICALDGDDTIEGLGGDDIIRGGAGDDTIHGGPGDDYLQGETGDDTIHGGDGEDLLLGGSGSDTLYGNAGYDTLGGGNTITEQNPGDKLYYDVSESAPVFEELTTEEVELLNTTIVACVETAIWNSVCPQAASSLCRTTSAGNSQWPDHQKQRTAITSFVCEAAGLAQRIESVFQNRPDYDPYPNLETRELRDTLKRDTQTLFTPLVEDNHQITETTTAKLRQLAESLHNFAIPAYRDDPPLIL